MDWHKTDTQDVLKQLNTTVERGLTQSEADQRLQKYGLNELVDRGTQNPWKILFDQFKSVMVLILIAAASFHCSSAISRMRWRFWRLWSYSAC